MLETPDILTRLASRRSASAFVGLVALALLHVSAMAHQFEHTADHGVGVCELCGAYSQLSNAVIPSAPGAEIVVVPHGTLAGPRVANFETAYAATYHSRAPPLS